MISIKNGQKWRIFERKMQSRTGKIQVDYDFKGWRR